MDEFNSDDHYTSEQKDKQMKDNDKLQGKEFRKPGSLPYSTARKEGKQNLNTNYLIQKLLFKQCDFLL